MCVVDANVNWTAIFPVEWAPVLKGPLFTDHIKGTLHFNLAHFREKQQSHKSTATNGGGLACVQDLKWVEGLWCYRALVWSFPVCFSPSGFFLLLHSLFPLLWLWAYELSWALPHYTPSRALKRKVLADTQTLRLCLCLLVSVCSYDKVAWISDADTTALGPQPPAHPPEPCPACCWRGRGGEPRWGDDTLLLPVAGILVALCGQTNGRAVGV